MAKTLAPKENYRVVVEPRWIGIAGWDEETCNTIAEQIRRHVDDVDSIRIEFDQKSICEHCGWRWTEESDSYNGGCCDEDEKNNPEPAA